MKKSLMVLFLYLILNLFGVTHEIKQDGTGDFTNIQNGINAATSSDTILVYPGTYFENINFLEKSITVASLYQITEIDSFINQTIIDGNQQARCVTISNCESAAIIGFTIQNGFASDPGWTGALGGGILIEYGENTVIANCQIFNNLANIGGGIGAFYTEYIHLKGNNINNNRGKFYGGGISAEGNELNIVFDTTSLNNIYLNYSAIYADIYSGYNLPEITNIIVDTLTITDPDFFFVGPLELCTITQLNSKIGQIDQDLYVSPSGSNKNSGTNPDEPLQTIAWAQTLIKRNDENPHTIFLAEGTYSPTLNNQIFPLNIKQGVTYKGISPQLTILDAENNSPFFFQISKYQEFCELNLENIKMVNGNSLDQLFAGAITIYQAKLNLDNIIIEDCIGDVAGAILTFNGYINLNNVLISDNYGSRALSFIVEDNCPNPVNDVVLTNTKIINNHPATFDPDFRFGTAVEMGGHPNIENYYTAKIINCEISGNHHIGINSSGLGGTAAISMVDNITVDVINCSIGDNTLSNDTGCSISLKDNSVLNLYNTILYDNEGYSLSLFEGANVNIFNSLIEGGNGNINYYNPQAIVNWHNGNLDENPHWIGENDDYPFYSLEATSPCINSGILDLPEGIELPEFDLAGNPRIHGETIDMGCYEFQEEFQSNEPDGIVLPRKTRIFNYPNPFNPTTTIKLNLAETGNINLSIYNIKGQKVKTLLDAYSCEGNFEIIWRGVDDNKRLVASGQYLIKLKVNGKEKAVRKCILLK